MKNDSVLGDRIEHPSFGIVRISRVSAGKGVSLFDSPFKHHHFVTLTVCEASKYRALNADHPHAGRELVSVSMSEVQFANMITSLNVGSGSSCTIEHVQGKDRPQCPVDATRETYAKEIRETVADLLERAEIVTKHAHDPKLKAEGRKEMRENAYHLAMELRSSAEFLIEQFEEKMNKSAGAAKAEIEAYWNHKVTSLGLQKLKGADLSMLMEIGHEGRKKEGEDGE